MNIPKDGDWKGYALTAMGAALLALASWLLNNFDGRITSVEGIKPVLASMQANQLNTKEALERIEVKVDLLKENGNGKQFEYGSGGNQRNGSGSSSVVGPEWMPPSHP